MLTLGQLVEFVLKNRKGNAFKDDNELDIAQSVYEAASRGELLYTESNDGIPTGLVIGRSDSERRSMFIINIITTSKSSLKDFIIEFKRRWPNYSLSALRRGYKVNYNTQKLCKKILKET